MAAGLDNLSRIVVLMMENRSFDHMLGGLMKTHPKINGLTGKESNPDTSGAVVTVQPNALFQSQLDPDPDHHFPGVDLQIFGGQHRVGSGGDDAGIREGLFFPDEGRQPLARHHVLLHPGQAAGADHPGHRICRVQRVVRVDSRADHLQPGVRPLRDVVRSGRHGCLLHPGYRSSACMSGY